MSRVLGDVFDVAHGHSLELDRLSPSVDANAVCFVSRTARNNGVSARVEPIVGLDAAPSGSITVALGGSVLETFVQPEPFYTAYHVAVLTAQEPMVLAEKLWWAACIRANKYRYNYGRQANKTLKDLVLPDAPPPWIERATASTTDSLSLHGTAQNPAMTTPPPKLDAENWGEFALGDLFELARGRYVPAASKTPGTTPAVTSTATNNGVNDEAVALPAEHAAGTITIARNGSVGEAFHQPRPYFASDDVHVLTIRGEHADEFTTQAALFVCAVARAEKYRYNYGRKWALRTMQATRIKLPVAADGTPDWEWMTTFVHSLPYSSVLADRGDGVRDD